MGQAKPVLWPRIYFYGSLFFSLLISWISFFPHGIRHTIVLCLALATIQILLFCKNVFKCAFTDIRSASIGLPVMLCISISAGWIYSVVYMFFPHWFIENASYFVYISWSISLYLLGELWNAMILKEIQIANMPDIFSKSVHKVVGGGLTVDVSISDIHYGDRLRIRQNEIIPVDGEVIIGSSYVDESVFSGNPFPVEKQRGDKVYAGTRNKQGSLILVVRLATPYSMYSLIKDKVIKIMSKKKSSSFFEQLSLPRYVPVVLLLAAVTFLLWFFFSVELALGMALSFTFMLLIVSCPVVLNLVASSSILYARSILKKNKIVMQVPNVMMTLSDINVVVFDKTGVLTNGKPVVNSVAWNVPDDKKDWYISIVRFIEKDSKHMFADTVYHYFAEDSESDLPTSSIEQVSEEGTLARIGDFTYLMGTECYMKDARINVEATPFSQYGSQGYYIYFVEDGVIKAMFYIMDVLKSEVKEVPALLQQQGIEVMLVTNENEDLAFNLANYLGIRSFLANALPDDKYDFIRRLQGQKKRVAMVGGAVNDAQALAQADVAIVTGNAADISKSVAHLSFPESNIGDLHKVFLFSKAVRNVQKNNAAFCIFCAFLAMIVAAGSLYPFVGVAMNEIIALLFILVMAVFIMINTLKLRF